MITNSAASHLMEDREAKRSSAPSGFERSFERVSFVYLPCIQQGAY